MATVSDALEQLNNHGRLADALCSGQVSLWLGLGLSMRALGDLDDVIGRVVAWLQNRATDEGWPTASRYSDALTLVRDQFAAVLVPPDRDLVRLPFNEWSDTPDALRYALESAYSQVLDVIDFRVRPQDLRTDVLDIPGTYSDPLTVPTSEHRLLALLIAEGLVGRVISTNWDDLVEKACESAGGRQVGVIAGPQDVAGNQTSPFLAKIHGCARKAGQDVAYVPSIVLTHSQIAQWAHPDNQAVRTLVDGVIREGGCCFIGLSARDFNIQIAHFDAAIGANPLPPDRLPTFAEATVGIGQERVLAAMAGRAAVDDGQIQALSEQATLGIRANDVLGAAYLNAFFRKLEIVADRMPEAEGAAYGAFVVEQLAAVREEVTGWLDGMEDDARWDEVAFGLSAWIARALAIYRDGALPADGLAYRPLTITNVPDAQNDPNLPLASLHRLLWSLLTLVTVARDTGMELRFPAGPGGGQLLLGPDAIATRVFVVHSNAGGPAALVARGLLDEDFPILFVNAASATPLDRVDMPTPAYPGVERLSQVHLEDFVSAPDATMQLRERLLAEIPVEGRRQ